MIIKNFKLALFLLYCLTWAGNGFTQDTSGTGAKKVIETFQTQLIEVMKNGQKLGFAGRYKKLYDPVSNSHDLPKIARFVIGKDWEKLSEDQQKQMVDVFSRFSIASYAHNFKDFSGESFTFDSEEETTRGGVVIHSHLSIPDDKPVKFDYFLKNAGDSWRIINIVANGVSDLALRRSEYSAILQREGFDALIKKISEKIDNYSKL